MPGPRDPVRFSHSGIVAADASKAQALNIALEPDDFEPEVSTGIW
jgi:hypothetical protein